MRSASGPVPWSPNLVRWPPTSFFGVEGSTGQEIASLIGALINTCGPGAAVTLATVKGMPQDFAIESQYLRYFENGLEITQALMPPTPIDSLPTGPGAMFSH